jgi:hypothetical protein
MNRKGKKKRPYLVNLGLVAGLLCGCVNAPKNSAEFEAMETSRFENWRDRVAAVHEEAAYAVVLHSASNVATVDQLHSALTLLSGKPIPAGAFKSLADRPEFAGLLRIAVLELAAYLGDGGLSPSPRLRDMLGAVAAGLVAGRDRAIAASMAQPVPDPEAGP